MSIDTKSTREKTRGRENIFNTETFSYEHLDRLLKTFFAFESSVWFYFNHPVLMMCLSVAIILLTVNLLLFGSVSIEIPILLLHLVQGRYLSLEILLLWPSLSIGLLSFIAWIIGNIVILKLLANKEKTNEGNQNIS